MLNRRRIMIMCSGGFSWLKAKITLFAKTIAGLGHAKATDVTSKLSTKTGRAAKLSAFNTGEINADEKVGNLVKSELKQSSATETAVYEKVNVSAVAKLLGYLRAPIEYLEKIRIVHTAESEQADANEISTAVNFKSDYIANGESAETNSAVIDVTTPQPKATATATFGTTQMAGLQIMPKIEHTATLSWWIYPEIDKNGCLYIRQAYETTQSDSALEVV